MAAATITNRRQNTVMGNRRVVCADSIAFASNGDTWAVPGMKRIEDISFTPLTTAANFAVTVSGNTITLVSSGAMTFLGTVTGI